VKWPAEFGKIFLGKLWVLLISLHMPPHIDIASLAHQQLVSQVKKIETGSCSLDKKNSHRGEKNSQDFTFAHKFH